MLEVADIVRRHGTALRAYLGDRLLPSQARALRDLVACRTAACGGQLTQCTACGRQVYRYHSCRNRHCSKCGGDQTARWLERHRARLLPCPHYLITVTLPAVLRPVAFGHQAVVYSALMRCAAAALQTLAADPRYVGTQVGCIAVLHTWTRALRYHPHVHLSVTAGGLSADRTQWIAPRHPAFLVPVQALSVIVRAKMCAALNQAGLLPEVPSAVWTTPWVVHAQPAGTGARVLEYLARYLFRVAISNSRLEQIDDDQVTFRYRDTRTQETRRATVPRRRVSPPLPAARAPAPLHEGPLRRAVARDAARRPRPRTHPPRGRTRARRPSHPRRPRPRPSRSRPPRSCARCATPGR